MIDKIIYVHDTFFRIHRDMGIELLREKGYEIELWSTYKIKYNNTLGIPKDISKDKVIYLKNRLEIIKRLKNQNWENTLLFITTTGNRGGIEDFIRITVSLIGGRYCNFIYELTPIGLAHSKKEKTWKSGIEEAISDSKLKIGQKIIGLYCKPTYCFVTTRKAADWLLQSWEKECAISVHNKDYDEYILSRRGKKPILQNYLVFIDDDMVNAEDFRKRKQQLIYPIPDTYYKNITKLFDKLEELYGLPVIIAAHPKSEYRGNEFGDRKIVYYKTEQLVREAKIVITHASAAMNYIVLYHKSYIFLIDQNIRKHMVWRHSFLPMIKEMNIKAFDFSVGNFDEKYINHYDSYYDRYMKKYIKETEDNGKLFYEIVDEYIQRL